MSKSLTFQHGHTNDTTESHSQAMTFLSQNTHPTPYTVVKNTAYTEQE